MLHVLGVLLLFIGSICKKTAKYFIGPLNVSFGLCEEEGWKMSGNISERSEAALSSFPSLDGTLCAGMCSSLGCSLETLVPSAELICGDAEATEQWQAVHLEKTWVKGTQKLSRQLTRRRCLWQTAGNGYRWRESDRQLSFGCMTQAAVNVCC